MSASLMDEINTALAEGIGRGSVAGRGSDGGTGSNGMLGRTVVLAKCLIVEKDHDEPEVFKLAGTFAALMKAVRK